MVWDFAVHGKVVFPQNGIEKWLALPLAPETFGPSLWPFDEPLDNPMTVKDSLCEWDPKQLHVTESKRTVQFRGYLSKNAMEALGNRLVAAFRVASNVGGKGELYLIGVSNTIAYKITVNKETSTLEKIDEDLEYSPEVSEVMSYPFDEVDNPWPARNSSAPPKSKKRKSSSPK